MLCVLDFSKVVFVCVCRCESLCVLGFVLVVVSRCVFDLFVNGCCIVPVLPDCVGVCCCVLFVVCVFFVVCVAHCLICH